MQVGVRHFVAEVDGDVVLASECLEPLALRADPDRDDAGRHAVSQPRGRFDQVREPLELHQPADEQNRHWPAVSRREGTGWGVAPARKRGRVGDNVDRDVDELANLARGFG